MKTKLPAAITTVEEAKTFLHELFTNNECFHPEDDANDRAVKIYTKEEGDQLNKLMADIYDGLNGGDHLCPVFCPCGYILDLEGHVME